MSTVYKKICAVFLILLVSAPVRAEAVSGARGYETVKNRVCQSNYPIKRGEVNSGSLVFWSENRKWVWSSIVDSSLYYLDRIQPKKKHSVTGEIKWVADEGQFKGWIVDGQCGNGWVKLQLKIR